MKHPKVGSALDDLIARVQAGEVSAEDAAREAPLHRGDSIGVAIHLSGNVDGVVRFLEANGASNISAGDDYIEAYVPVLLLAETSEQPGVIRVRSIQPPEESQSGSGIPGNGPEVHGSIAWNQAGYTGTGIKVGVIDSGFAGFAGLMGTEVPANVQVRCYRGLGEHSQDLDDCGGGSHGTVVAESVMDIAPDASLYISDPQSLGDLRDAVDWMISEGVSVINHSRTWPFDGPGDGTSPSSISPLNTVDRAVAAGIVWVNAAGNSAQHTWFQRGPFSYDTISVDGEDVRVINFEASNFKNRFHLWGALQLRWDDTWGGATRDLDLFLVAPDSGDIALASVDPQSGEDGHYPYERVSSGAIFDIMVANRGGSEPGWVQLLAWKGGGGSVLTFNTPDAGSITNPAESANPGMLTVGATRWSNVSSIENYSSRGPTPDGRIKPDLVGADCGQTAARSSPFCGTSQASPHVAGMAALVLQRFPGYSPAQVVVYLKENAEQRIGSPDPNNTWGHGFIVVPPPLAQLTGSPSIRSITPSANSLTVSWSAPSSGDGSTITTYDLRHIEASADETMDANWTLVEDVWTSGSGQLRYELTGLAGGTPYDVQVRSVSIAGDGPWSTTASAATGSAPAPDLVVDTPTVDTSAPEAGAAFTLSATVRNQGNGRLDSTTLRYYQSTDSTITTGDTEVGTDSISSLDASESGDESISLTTPSTSGVYYYGACVDAVSDESDTTNNCSPAVTVTVGAAPAPDLVVDAPTVDTGAPAAGARFTLSATVRNQGSGRSDSTTLRYYQSTDATITDGDTEVGTDSVFRLVASGSGDEWISLTAPSTPGTYYYGACVERVSGESDTTNNCSPAVTVTVGAAPAPDLVVDAPTVSESAPAAGGSFTLSATVRNQGAARSDSTTLRYYQSSDATITTGDTEVGTDSVFGLAASWSGDESISLNAPSTPGTYYYGACVDEVNGELDTQNNCSLAVTLTVGAAPAPDLVVDTPTVSESATAAGASFTLSATVRNQGAARSDSTTLRYYQSSDATITTGDTEVGTDSVFGLAASWSGDESISLNAPSTPGTYYYGACVDEVAGELDTQNNCSAAMKVTVGAAPAPDLVVDTPTVSESAPAAGARFTLSATVRNQGAARSDSTTLRYYQSSDATITTGDTEVGTDSVFGLAASWSGDESISLNAPSTPGTYYYGACVDAVSGESDTTNNCSPAVTVTVGAAPAPDLVVDAPTVDTGAPAAGARFTLSATVRNQGSGRSDSTTLRYYQSTDATITDGDTEVGTDSVFRLVASGSGDEWISLTAPSTPGTYYYGACVERVSGESDTTNNCSPAVTVTVGAAPAPDLVVDAPTVNIGSPAAGARFTLSATVRNQGNGRSDSTTLRYYQSTDSTITAGDTEVGTDSVFRLVASGSGDESTSLTAPSTSGTYYYGACVEAVSGESDATNNCSPAVTVTVGAAPAPDLVVDAPTVSESAPAAGGSFTLSATVRNQGAARSDSTTLRYYQSSDATITTGDTEVGTDSVFGLAASWSGDESISLNAPSTPGTYYYGACVDEVNGELDTQNNCSAAMKVTVGAAPAPDLVVDTPTVSESAPAAGARFTLSATVRNQGAARSDSTTLRYYQSSDATITTGDTEVGTDSVSRLDASQSGDESISLTAPSTPGTYYYGTCVDAVSGESDTTNNCSPAVTVTVGSVNAYGVGDFLPGVPTSGLFIPAVTVGASVSSSGGSTTITFTNGGYIELQDGTRYTCQSTGGCGVHNGEVTQGTLVSQTTSVLTSDLIVDPPTVSESAPTAGARFTLSATVRNQGNGRSESTTLRYYQSTDSTITSGDTEFGTDSVSGLGASGNGDESISLTAPSSAGTYYYGACVDSLSDESDTTNNCSLAVTVTVGAAPAPDLVVDAPTVSEVAPAAGARIALSTTVRNQGNGSSNSTTLRYYQSTDSVIDAGDTEVGRDSVFRLDASQTEGESVSLTAPSTPGTYYYGACVDSVSGESDTTNNCSPAVTVAVGAAPAPDVVLSAPRVSDSTPTANASFIFSVTSENRGSASSQPTTLRIYLSTDSTVSASDSELGTYSVPLLGPGGGFVSNATLSTPSTPGTYYYGACVEGVSNESDTTNNCSPAVTVTVGAAPAPDLVVEVPTVSESAPAAGGSFTLSTTVRNQGNGSSTFTTLRYYHSTDSTITTGDTEVGTDSVSRLNASQGGDESVSLTAPSSPGTYYYGACVDAASGESDTTNNCSPAVTVTVGSGNSYGVGDFLPGVPTSGLFIPAVTVGASVSSSGGSTTITFTNGGYIELQDGTRYTCQSTGGCGVHNGEVTQGTLVSQTTSVLTSDLIVDPPTVSESAPAAGARFTLSATVRNQGSGASGSTTLRYYQSADSTITAGDTEVGTDSVFGLAASGSGDESISLTAPSTPGTLHYGACVDSVSGETDTNNNCSPAVTVTVGAAPAPDLVVDTPTVSDTNVRRRFVFTLSAIVRNQGNGPTRSDAAIRIRYYRSTDSTITTSDEEVDWTWGDSGSIPAGGSITRSVMVAAPFAAGIHYYGACVSPTQGEANTENNCSAAVAITVPMEPDVVVDSPTVSDSSPAAGQSFTLTVAVHNRGNASSAPTTIRYNRSTDPTLSTFQEVGTGSVGGLAVSESTTVSTSLTAPSSPGMYYYDACVDSVPGEVEAGLNNCSAAVTVTVTAAAGAPDLAVDTPTVGNSTLVIGSNFSLFATVRNRGSATSEATTLRYYRSTDLTITTSDTEVGTDSVESLVSSSSSDQSIGLPAPSTTGTYYFGACVDAVSNESDTTNNCSGPVRVTVGAPDLVVETPTVSDSSPVVGASFTLSATLRNQGDGAAGIGQLEFYRSTDFTITDSDEYLGYALVHPIDLGPSGGSEESISLTAPSTPGTYYYGACVREALHESDTTNNCSASVSVIVRGAPDLVVDTPTVSESAPYARGSFTLSVTVRNQGNGSAGSTSLRYYRSVDPATFRGYTEIGTDSVSGLDSSGSSDESIGLTAPSTPGTYYYYACVDEVSGESDTTNNCSASVTVTVNEAIRLRLNECFVFQNQHFARFEVTARIAVSSLVVKTYAVDSRNNERHLMETTNVGSLSAGSSHEELTTRFFPASLAQHLTSCSVSATWQ